MLDVEIVQRILFDYDSLDADTADYLKQNAQETRGMLKRTSEDIIQIGRNLLAARSRLSQGKFIPWVKVELGISQPTAWRFMQMAKGKPVKSFNMNDLVVLPPVEPKEDSLEVRPSRTNDDKRQAVVDFFTEFSQLQALSEADRYKLALQSNNAAETVVPSTLVTYAEFIWDRLAEKKYTQSEVGLMLGWNKDSVKDYAALKKIDSRAWDIVGATFEHVALGGENDAAPSKGAVAPFTEGLLRSIFFTSHHSQNTFRRCLYPSCVSGLNSVILP